MKSKKTKPGRSTKTASQERLSDLGQRVKAAARNEELLRIVEANSKRSGELPELDIAIDAHETLFNFLDPMTEYIAEGRRTQGFPFDKLSDKKRIWSFSCDPANDVTPGEFAADFVDFCSLDEGGFGSLPLLSKRVPKMLSNLHTGGPGKQRFVLRLWSDVPAFHDINPLTGAWMEYDSARKATYDLVAQHNLPIAHEHIEFYNPNEKVENMRRKGILLLVDDKDSTAMKVEEIGRVAFVVKHSFNGKVNSPRVVYLDSIDQLEFAVRTFFSELYRAMKEREHITGPLRKPPFVDFCIG